MVHRLPQIRDILDTDPIRGVGVLRFPEDVSVVLEDGTVVTARDVARQAAGCIRQGSVLVLPSTRDEWGQYEWDFRIEGGSIDQVKIERKEESDHG